MPTDQQTDQIANAHEQIEQPFIAQSDVLCYIDKFCSLRRGLP